MKEEGKESEDINHITDIIGKHGKWQNIIFAFLFVINFIAAWHNLVLSFMAPNVDHWCTRPPEYVNASIEDWKQMVIPVIEMKQNHPVYSKCKRYEQIINNNSVIDRKHNKTIPCQNWEYDHSFYTSTILEKWNLVCKDSWLISLSQSIYMSGVLLGTLTFGHVSDRFGRRLVLLMSVALIFFAGSLCAFSANYVMFTITRFFVGWSKSGLLDTCFVHLMESLGSNQRAVMGIAADFGWTLGYTTLPGIVWLIRNWFLIQLAITLPTTFLITMWWWLPESPRWLLTHGKIKDAEIVIKKAMKINKVCTSDFSTKVQTLASKVNSEGNTKIRTTILDLFKNVNLREKTLLLCLNWFIISFIFYGISFNTDQLGGNTFLNFFIIGIIELPANIACIFIIKYLGRRIPLTVAVVASGVACVITIPITDDLFWLRIIFVTVGKMTIAIAYSIVYVYTSELFPTVVRSIGLGTCSSFAGIGSIIAPFIKELEIYTHPSVPQSLFGGLGIISGLLILRLPETKDLELYDTFEQDEQSPLQRKRKN